MKIICNHESLATFITLNNPTKRNAFDAEMSYGVIESINTAMEKKQNAVVIKSNLSNGVFSAGHDLGELRSADDIVNDPMFEMFERIKNCSIPVIASVNGMVFAGSLHMLMVCDMVYATRNAKVLITANKMGVPFSLRNYSNWLSVMGIHKIKELFYRATPISAEDAYNSGIFNAVLDDDEGLDNEMEAVLHDIANCNREGIANTKLQLNTLANYVLTDYKHTMKIERERNRILKSEEFVKRIDELIEKIHHGKV